MERITIKKRVVRTTAVGAQSGSAAPALMDMKGRPSDSGMVWGDWNEVQHFEGLTPEEIKALKLKHKTPTPNLARALDVKSMILQGMKCGHITRTLRAKWGERMMRADHAALSPLVKCKK